MKHLFLVLATILCITTSSAQTYTTWSAVKQVRYGTEIIYQTYKGELLDGTYKVAESSYGGYSEITFKQGKANGTWTDYSSEGKKEDVSTFINGIIDGKAISYFQNQTVESESYWDKGKKVGTWKSYTKKGKVRSTETYKDGMKHGKWKKTIIHPQTQTTSTSTEHYKNDQRTGTWTSISNEDNKLIWSKKYTAHRDYTEKRFFPTGTLHTTKSYKDNKPHGIHEEYTASGLKITTQEFENGSIILKKKYYENGITEEISHYKNSRKEGTHIFYNKKGNKTFEIQYLDGYKNGKSTAYNDDKQLLWEQEYKNGAKEGTYKEYNKAGNLHTQGDYNNGQKTGIWKIYSLAGKVKKEIIYKAGVQLSEKTFN
ncbi:toxin-antitoxin system YwqK family antitoxin [Aquimarina sp. I32.4]|uniref:toxin-antitoxin system YwqK family antitoxin n=1 Tax=Aquimarina sp. I32.4 TaxID=2053903 RepID=UPI000CDF0F7E|nr:toxin-antitoxin system YwqK family antitoxin [Aquimarina sp. I32.4]